VEGGEGWGGVGWVGYEIINEPILF